MTTEITHYKENPANVEAVGYKIIVSPISFSIPCWEFVLLIPTGMEEQENILVVKEVLENLLDKGDHFSASPLTHEDEQRYKKGVPLMMFDKEDPETFEWIIPPMHMRN
jgi:hypothetical protein